MSEQWFTYPAQMGEHQCFISYDHGYADIAESDGRDRFLSVRIQFDDPLPSGLPTPEEFAAIAELDDELHDALSALDGICVGRITVNGFRYFNYFLAVSEAEISAVVDRIADSTPYPIQAAVELDPDKNGYWKEVYPTPDDWQVIQDLRVLEALEQHGDHSAATREVSHWAYFESASAAADFATWAANESYSIVDQKPEDDQGKFGVRFTHFGTMELADITSHTIKINRKVNDLHGDYDGWETSVERISALEEE